MSRRARELLTCWGLFAAAAGCASPAPAADRGASSPDRTRRSDPPSSDVDQSTANVDGDDARGVRDGDAGEPSAGPIGRRALRSVRAARAEVADANAAATDRSAGWRPPLPDQPSPRVFLTPDRYPPGSLSVGRVGGGRLIDAVGLPVEGPHHAILEPHRERRTRWGTRQLVSAIERAADGVASEYPGSTLKVGNLSRRTGGDIRWSSSHNSGRDADLAFYVRRADDGRRIPAPALVEFGADGRAVDRAGLVFDTARNWRLVEALLTDPEIELQWLFISRPLKEKLLAHGRREGASSILLQRARKVLHQPSDAPPHADHLHVRIRCSRRDRLEGCLDYGPAWAWVDSHRRALLARTLATRPALESDSKQLQLRALEYLYRIRAPDAPEAALLHAADSPHAEVRSRALEVAADIPDWSASALVAADELLRERQLQSDVRAKAYSILRRARDPLSTRLALSLLLDRGARPKRRELAARALKHALDPTLVPVLIDELPVSAPRVRAALAEVLRRITARTEGLDWRESTAREARAGCEAWRGWWRRHRHKPRRRWLLDAYARHGFEGEDLDDDRAVGELIDLLRETPDHVAYNANRTIHQVTGRWIPLEAWSYDRLYRYWSRWWENNRTELVRRD